MPPGLLDLRLFELDVLAHLRVVLLEAQLFGLGARILLGHVEEARVGAADELDLDGCRLGHGSIPIGKKKSGRGRLKSRRPMTKARDSVNRRGGVTSR